MLAKLIDYSSLQQLDLDDTSFVHTILGLFSYKLAKKREDKSYALQVLDEMPNRMQQILVFKV